MQNEPNGQQAVETPQPKPAKPQKSKKRKISLLTLWATQVISIFRLTRTRNALLHKSNTRFNHRKQIKSPDDKERIASIEDLQKLININIATLLNSSLIVIMLMVVGASIYLLLPKNSTLVKLDLKVTSVEWVNDNDRIIDPDRFNIYFESPGTGSFFLDSARLSRSSFNISGYRSLSLRPTQSIRVEKMHFPKQSRVKLEHIGIEGLNLNISTDVERPPDSTFKFDVIFPQAEISTGPGLPYEMKGTIDSNSSPQSISVEKNLGSGKTYILNFRSVSSWQWPSGIYAKNIAFEETNAVKGDPISSVINGKINMLETNDSAIVVSERDVVITVFTTPVQLFLSGDSTGIYVHMEGEVTALESGPQIMGDKNDRMPKRMKVVSEKAPYVWILITIIISLITMIKIRDR